jgi:hypothetical protein
MHTNFSCFTNSAAYWTLWARSSSRLSNNKELLLWRKELYQSERYKKNKQGGERERTEGILPHRGAPSRRLSYC